MEDEEGGEARRSIWGIPNRPGEKGRLFLLRSDKLRVKKRKEKKEEEERQNINWNLGPCREHEKTSPGFLFSVNHLRLRNVWNTVNYSPSSPELEMGRFVTCGAQLEGCGIKTTESVCERNKELARWDLQRRQWELKVPREASEEYFQVRCHPSASAIGCFCPATADSPSQPGQLVEKKKRLSCLAILSLDFQEQIFLIVKKRSAALQGP